MTKQDSQAVADPFAVRVCDPRFALGQSIGLAAFIWGYPLVETLRTCRLQILAGDDERVAWRAPIDCLQHVLRASTSDDRDVVTPANDLLYTTGWINLANGPRMLRVPSSKSHHGRYFVLALYDAWTENFENPGRRNSPPDGETLLLVGPSTPAGDSVPNGLRLVRSPTNLIWMIARVVVGEGADVPLAQALQADIRIESPSGTDSGYPPAAVEHWVGAPQDTLAALQERPQDAHTIAGAFFSNLCLCLADAPPSLADSGLADWFQRGKLVPGRAFDWAWLDGPLREGLQQGLLDGAALVVSQSRSQIARPWVAHYGLGRYGTNYLTRALTAYKGLGALASDEAVYAMGDFDADKQPLDGRHDYLMRFEPSQMPPADAFWSVTLYAADRFLFANPIRRYSIGDRTEGLRPDPDGGLTLRIGHKRPSDSANWLPAPAGSFYLILRMYSPLPDARSWHIPPLQRIAQSALESTLP